MHIATMTLPISDVNLSQRFMAYIVYLYKFVSNFATGVGE